MPRLERITAQISGGRWSLSWSDCTFRRHGRVSVFRRRLGSQSVAVLVLLSRIRVRGRRTGWGLATRAVERVPVQLVTRETNERSSLARSCAVAPRRTVPVFGRSQPDPRMHRESTLNLSLLHLPEHRRMMSLGSTPPRSSYRAPTLTRPRKGSGPPPVARLDGTNASRKFVIPVEPLATASGPKAFSDAFIAPRPPLGDCNP